MQKTANNITFCSTLRQKKRKNSGCTDIHRYMYYTVQFTTSFKRENCSMVTIQNSRNLLSLHILIHISLKKIKTKVDKQDWFNLISVACSCHRSIFSYSSFIVIQWYLWSVTKSASTVIFLYCQTNLICNNRFFPLLYEKEKFQRCWPI